MDSQLVCTHGFLLPVNQSFILGVTLVAHALCATHFEDFDLYQDQLTKEQVEAKIKLV